MAKKTYLTPTLTVASFHSEKGFALSLPFENQVNPIDNYIELMMFDNANNDSYRETETFIEHSVWTEDNTNYFWQ